MTLRIVSNTPAINAHRYLYGNDRAINKTLEKISSGLEIVRASDGPADLIISEQLRSQISGLKQAVRNAETGVSMVQTTEGAMEELNRLLTDLRRLAVHASNDAVNDKLMLQADQNEVEYIIDSINRIATQTSFGTKQLLDGSNGVQGVGIGKGIEFISGTVATQSSGAEGYDLKIEEVATRATSTSDGDFNVDDFSQDVFIPGEEKYIKVVQDGKSSNTIIGEGATLDLVIGQLNRDFKANNLDLRAYAPANDNKKIAISSNEYGEGHTFTVASDIDGLYGTPDAPVQAIDGTSVKGMFSRKEIVNGQLADVNYLATGKGNVLTGYSGTPAEGLQVRYNETGDEQGPDTPVGKVVVAQNSLTFQVGADHGQYLKFDLASVFAKDLANGIKNDSKYTSIADIDLRTFQGAQDALKMVVAASNDVSTVRGRLGALQKDSLEPTVNYVRNLVENMTYSESVIREADVAEKTADLVKRQIQAQASASAQVHASNSPRIVQGLLNAVTPQ